ncbi:isochorismate synthase [Prevotella sp. TCVGH]|uniref:isochorismate synthase n=1 Tax=Prevotella sp. TCVGH TaxID=2182433 RepID=UPI00201D89C3|nr:isochorismate synthase [Prevotella sp. TCVGH]MCL6749052.1 isochorismate synthase [Prevotella sp. TCVGH]
MNSFAYYRLPDKRHFIKLTQKNGEPETYFSLTDLNGKEGFVLAPFKIDEAHPVVLFHPETKERVCVGDCFARLRNGCGATVLASSCDDRERYGEAFRCFHQQLKDGKLAKIVLARCEEIPHSALVDAETLFLEACRTYPHLCIMLVSTPQTGTWLMATPEVLLDGDGETWRTMALAGTMKARELAPDADCSSASTPCVNGDGMNDWSAKNKQEQQLVATYIQQCLSPFSDQLTQRGPYTVQAGDLVHLRSDFMFSLHDTQSLGSLLEALHPTPAVCGLPKTKAQRFILQHEHDDRSYYSGFAGLLDPNGETHLYVSLRCMQILENSYRLYAGGGLLLDSVEQQEWEETEAKMETMKKITASPPTPPQSEGEL